MPVDTIDSCGKLTTTKNNFKIIKNVKKSSDIYF